MDRDVEGVGDRRHQPRRATLDGAVDPGAPAGAGDRHVEIAREGHERGALGRGVEADDHDRVAPHTAVAPDANRVVVGQAVGGVGPDDQVVLRGVVGCAEVGCELGAQLDPRDLAHSVPAPRDAPARPTHTRQATELRPMTPSCRGVRWTRSAPSASPCQWARSAGIGGQLTGRPRPRLMTRRWISLVPSPISRILASRY